MERPRQPARACENLHTYRSDEEWAGEDGWDQEIGDETVEPGNDIEKANAVSVCTHASMCMCVCVCVCYIHVHIHMWMRMNTNMYTHMYSYI